MSPSIVNNQSTGQVDLEVDCAIPGEFSQASVNYITVTAPAEARAGEPVELAVTLKSHAVTPRELAKNEVTAELQLEVRGPSGTTLTVSGLTNPELIALGEVVFLDFGSVSFTPATPGVYEFVPGDHTVVTSDHPVLCTVTAGSGVAASTEVRA
ncbi:MAG: hypothetical protein ABIQ18_03660 [Umezawaea sp.]